MFPYRAISELSAVLTLLSCNDLSKRVQPLTAVWRMSASVAQNVPIVYVVMICHFFFFFFFSFYPPADGEK